MMLKKHEGMLKISWSDLLCKILTKSELKKKKNLSLVRLRTFQNPHKHTDVEREREKK